MNSQILKVALISGVSFLFSACGGGGGSDDSESDNSYIFVHTANHATDRPSAEVSGQSYIPSSATCIGFPVFKGVFNTEYRVTWYNSTTGTSGEASVDFICFLTAVVNWSANVPLGPGPNEISIRLEVPGEAIDDTDLVTVTRIDDVTPPEIVEYFPKNNATDVSIGRPIEIVFNDRIDPVSVSTASFAVTDADNALVAGSYSSYGDKVYFAPDNPLTYGMTYSVRVSTEIRDLFGGNNLPTEVQWSFTTEANPDQTPPEVVSNSPGQNSICAAVDDSIAITFSEAIEPASLSALSFYLVDDSGNEVGSTLSYSEPVAMLRPARALDFDRSYTATVTQAISDFAGNAMASDFVLNFKTAPMAQGYWIETSVDGAPTDLHYPSAVWTGDRMIVWGMQIYYDWSWTRWIINASGAVYDPVADSWSDMNMVDAPAGGMDLTPIWTGSEMIVWSGGTYGGIASSGSAYNPETDTWRKISTLGQPAPREYYNTIWTGTEMIVWGGTNGQVSYSDGARYDPVTDSWSPVSNLGAPVHRDHYSNTRDAVWTGTEMIIFNGKDPEQSRRYNPVTDSWSSVSKIDAPRFYFNPKALWTGEEMLVWDVRKNEGKRYSPETDSWSNLTLNCAPEFEQWSEVIWAGDKMVVWGGSGGAYSPDTDSWQLLNPVIDSSQRVFPSFVWAGDQAILWSGQKSYTHSTRYTTGARYFF